MTARSGLLDESVREDEVAGDDGAGAVESSVALADGAGLAYSSLPR
jgi:hypothetical protein